MNNNVDSTAKIVSSTRIAVLAVRAAHKATQKIINQSEELIRASRKALDESAKVSNQNPLK